MADGEWNTVSHKHKRDQHGHGVQTEDDGGDVVVYSPPKKKYNRREPLDKFVLILVGIPGSGKSTFASKLVEVCLFVIPYMLLFAFVNEYVDHRLMEMCSPMSFIARPLEI